MKKLSAFILGIMLSLSAMADPTINLQTNVRGILPLANGGTANATGAAAALTGGVIGDIPYQSGSGTTTFLAPGTAGGVLMSQGSAAPIFAQAPSSIISITATVAANALTVSTGTSTSLGFRSTTLGSGAVTVVSGTPTALVVPSGATLGTVNAVQSRIAILELNNAGTPELAVVNVAGGNNLGETTLISTTAISASATAANVIYSASARTSVAFRVIGYVESTQATAGTWATSPSTVQGYGGQAMAAWSSLGYGQTWQTVTGSRVDGTTYYNTTGKPIDVGIFSTGASATTLTVGGVIASSSQGTTYAESNLSAIVPPGASYVSSGVSGTVVWAELR
jgi:hypothetical protein